MRACRWGVQNRAVRAEPCGPGRRGVRDRAGRAAALPTIALAPAATASVDPSVPPPGLYGVWATSDSCSWNGDYTLDYNAEAVSALTRTRP